MEHEFKIVLSKRRLEVAHERFDVAKHLLEYGDYKTSANRLYYAVFAAMKAVLALTALIPKNIPALFHVSVRSILKQAFLIRVYPYL